MAGLKEVRIRIASVTSTQQITSAMKMVAASKLRKAQNNILALRPYASKLKGIIQNLSSNGSMPDSVYTREEAADKVLLIVITSNRGMCGAFNSSVNKATLEHIQNNFSDQYQRGNLHLVTIGKKGTDFFSRRNFKVEASFNDIFDKLDYQNVSEIANQVMGWFKDKTYNRVDIVYNQFKNAATQVLAIEQMLPVVPEKVEARKTEFRNDYIFEPAEEELLTSVIPQSLRIQLYKALLDSYASEFGARMTAMHKATENAGELLKDLRIRYNNARQAAITKELIEIVSGAEVLKK
ncbi:MAG: ATP synthase F1 subunit gamma [Bacteroidota bacterium]|nr:ATP synthase F1 subunit gamma [Bacteroidota bacterium]